MSTATSTRPTAMCLTCGTTRSVSTRARVSWLKCAACDERTHHATPLAEATIDHKEVANARTSQALRELAAVTARIRRLGIEVDTDSHDPEIAGYCVWHPDDEDDTTEIAISADLPTSTKLQILKHIWGWFITNDAPGPGLVWAPEAVAAAEFGVEIARHRRQRAEFVSSLRDGDDPEAAVAS